MSYFAARISSCINLLQLECVVVFQSFGDIAILAAYLIRFVTDPQTGRIQNTNRNTTVSTRKFSHSCPCYIFVQMRPSAQNRFGPSQFLNIEFEKVKII
jgi:hypothetical protein